MNPTIGHGKVLDTISKKSSEAIIKNISITSIHKKKTHCHIQIK